MTRKKTKAMLEADRALIEAYDAANKTPDKAKTTTREKLIEEAEGLLEPGEEAHNREYLRGMCELISRAFPKQGLTTGDSAAKAAQEIAKMSFKRAFKVMYG